MKLKEKEAGLMIFTIIEGLQELKELPDTIVTIYVKMLTLLFNHFIYSIKDLKSIEEFTEEEKSFLDLPVLGVFLDPDTLPDRDPFKDAILKARVMSMEQELQEYKNNDNPIIN